MTQRTGLKAHADKINQLKSTDAKWRAVHNAYASDSDIVETPCVTCTANSRPDARCIPCRIEGSSG